MDLKARLEQEFLPYVTKPARYLGNEYNTIQKKLSEVELRIAFCHPAIYEQGMADVIFEFLYYALNSHPAIWAERIFTPSSDAVNILREKNLPLFSLESKTALDEFHIIIILFRSELEYIDLINILQLGRIPLRAQNRRSTFPLIIGGGMWNWNPEPVADFLDVALIGNLTTVALQLFEAVLRAQRIRQTKTDLLKQLSRFRDVYVPAFYEAIYDGFGEYSELKKSDEAFPNVIEAINSHDSDSQLSFQTELLFPLIRVDYSLTDNNEGTINSLETNFLEQVREEDSTETRLFFLLNGNAGLVWKGIKEKIFLSNENLHLSLPDFKIESSQAKLKQFDFLKEEEIRIFARAGSQRLRAISNAHYRDDDLCRLISLLIKKGWRQICLDFRIGYPTEKDEDITQLTRLIQRCAEICQAVNDMELTIRIAPFVPRPFSMFQWEGFESRQKLEAKYQRLQQSLDIPNLNIIFEDIWKNMLQTALSRGSRSLSKIIEAVWLSGATTQFIETDFAAWDKALEENGTTWDKLLKPISATVPLPWDHIDYGVSKYQLKNQRLKAFQGQIDSSLNDYVHIGKGMPREKFEKLIKDIELKQSIENTRPAQVHSVSERTDPIQYGRKIRKQVKPTTPIKKKIRIQYAKTGLARFISHLDVGRIFELSARRASIALVYTQGKSPHPKFSFGPPLPIGISSIAEYIDLEVEIGDESDIQSGLNKYFPEGIKIVQYQPLFKKVPSLSAVINLSDYEIALDGVNLPETSISDWLNSKEIWVERQVKEETQKVDIRSYIVEMKIDQDLLKIRTRIIEGKTVRINEIFDSLQNPGEIDPSSLDIRRVGQFIEKDGEIFTPFNILS